MIQRRLSAFTSIAVLGITLLLASCDDTNEVGLELEDGNLTAFYTDTVTVSVSTVLLDSIATSGTGTMLVGQYEDAIVGKTTASTFFEIGRAHV